MITKEFTSRIGVMPITLSVFEDKNGFWAKDFPEFVRLKVVFEDGTTQYLTPDEYKALPADQQTLIRHAPSSPAGEPEGSEDADGDEP